jgi:hypothetical protein
MSQAVTNSLVELARAAADVRRRDVEVMANFRAFPRFLWSEATNRHVALAQDQIGSAYRGIFAAVGTELNKIPSDSDLHRLAVAIRDYCAGGAEAADRFVALARFMDENALRRPFHALFGGWKLRREISRIDQVLDRAAARIKEYWPD